MQIACYVFSYFKEYVFEHMCPYVLELVEGIACKIVIYLTTRFSRSQELFQYLQYIFKIFRQKKDAMCFIWIRKVCEMTMCINVLEMILVT